MKCKKKKNEMNLIGQGEKRSRMTGPSVGPNSWARVTCWRGRPWAVSCFQRKQINHRTKPLLFSSHFHLHHSTKLSSFRHPRLLRWSLTIAKWPYSLRLVTAIATVVCTTKYFMPIHKLRETVTKKGGSSWREIYYSTLKSMNMVDVV